MKRQCFLSIVGVLILAAVMISGVALAQGVGPETVQEEAAAARAAAAAPLDASFTYQGHLTQDGEPVNGSCDFRFTLYDGVDGAPVGAAQEHLDQAVSDGDFAVQLDFGSSVFGGDRRWLGAEVDCTGAGSYADLGRQELTAVPYALYATGAPWSGLTGAPPPFDDTVSWSEISGIVGSGASQVAAGSHNHDTRYYTESELQVSGAGGQVHWDNLMDVPQGLEDGDDVGGDYANVIVVAKSGGDFAAVQDAIDSVTDASAANPYLVWVAPGVYDVWGTITMRPHVHVQGAGQEATVIAQTIELTHHVSLRDLTVGGDTVAYGLQARDGVSETLVADVTALALYEASYTPSYNYAISLDGSSTRVTLRNVTARAENAASGSFGLDIDSAQVTLYGGSFTGRGGGQASGIFNFGSGGTLEVHDVTVLGEGAGLNYGLRNYSGVTATLHGGTFTAHGEEAWAVVNGNGVLDAEGISAQAEATNGTACGLYNFGTAEATLRGGAITARGSQNARAILNTAGLAAESVTALAEDASDSNYGLYNASSSDAVLRGGSFTGRGGSAAGGIHNDGSGTTVEAENVTARGELASGSGSKNYGLYNRNSAEATLRGGAFAASGGSSSLNYGLMNESTATLRGGVFEARNGLDATGIYNTATLTAQSITALGESATNNYGLEHASASTADVTESVLEGATYSVYRSAGTITVSNSRLIGAASGAITCVGVSRGLVFASSGCP